LVDTFVFIVIRIDYFEYRKTIVKISYKETKTYLTKTLSKIYFSKSRITTFF
jgi:hypothetical protein